jgi:hypothetical protein
MARIHGSSDMEEISAWLGRAEHALSVAAVLGEKKP